MTERPRNASSGLLPVGLLLLWGALSCRAQGLEANFDTGWRAEGPSSSRLEEGEGILTQLEQSTAPQQTAAVVGLTGRGLNGRTLPSGKKWHYQGTVDVLPSLAANLVAFSGDGNVTVLDVRDGKLLFALPAGGRRLEGMSSDGNRLVLLLVDESDARPDQVLIVDKKGQIVDSTTSIAKVGTPLALSGIALLPWKGLYVSAFDLSTGAPQGRLLVRDGVHRVESFDGHPWALGEGASRIDERLLDTLGQEPIRLNLDGLPGDPVWPVDGTKPRLPRASPITVWAEPEFRGAPRFRGDRFVYAYFDVIMGLHARTQSVLWTNYFKRPILGGASSRAGVNVCLEDGSVYAVSLESGQTEKLTSLATRLKACVIVASPRKVKERSARPVPHQIQRTIRNTSPSMAAAHEFLLADLAGQQGARATRALLAIARDPLASSALSSRAADHLTGRRSAATAMIRALEDGAPSDIDALGQSAPAEPAPAQAGSTQKSPKGENEPQEDSGQSPRAAAGDASEFELPSTGLRPVPVAALAKALAAMKATRAAPVLARYLRTPGIDGSATRAVMEALMTLGNQSQVPQVREYFFRYKNAGGDAASIRALALSASFLLMHGTQEDQQRVRASTGDILTHPDVKQAIAAVLDEREDPTPTEAEAP